MNTHIKNKFRRLLIESEDIRIQNMHIVQPHLEKGKPMYDYVMSLPDMYLDEVGIETILDFLSVEDGMNFRLQHGITKGNPVIFKRDDQRGEDESEIDYILRKNKIKYTWDQIRGRLVHYFIRRLAANLPREEVMDPNDVHKFIKTYGEAFLYGYLIPMSNQV